MMKAIHGHPGLPEQGLVPIRTVSSLTGVNSVTLRAWERRYDLIKPLRTPKGHRLYSMADVDLIHQVVALLDHGMSIGQARQALDADPATGEVNRIEAESGAESLFDPWQHYQTRLLQAIADFDDSVLSDGYDEALSLYPVDIVTTRLIMPLLRTLGDRWAAGQGSIAEEHFFSVFLRNKLGARFHHLSRGRQGPKLLAACLPGEQHEVGLLLFALAALDRDYRVILLGPNTPLAELPAVTNRTASGALVLSGSAEVSPTVIETDLPRLCRMTTVPVFIGGRVVERYPEALTAAGAILLEEDLSLALRRIGAARVRR